MKGFVPISQCRIVRLIYSTYLGRTDWDLANDLMVNAGGEAFVTGNTNSVADTRAGCPPNGPSCGNNPPDLFALPTIGNAYMQPPVTGGCPNVQLPHGSDIYLDCEI